MYSQVQGPQNVILCFAPASQNGLKGKNTRLTQLSEQIWVAEKTYKGGALKRPAPLCRFPLSHKLFRLVLKSRIFSFQSILACCGSEKLYFGDLELTQNLLCIFQTLILTFSFSS